mmetsp:Transcript_9600/g.24069  ORF Transcript_9600/g.24069 Transcript_9600/m.24069 type:complete len:90 (-) Transcript_9600:98-367(-)
MRFFITFSEQHLYMRNLKSLNVIFEPSRAVWVVVDVGPVYTYPPSRALYHYHQTFDNRWHTDEKVRAPPLKALLLRGATPPTARGIKPV